MNLKMDRFIYADNAATTQLSPKVLEKMMPYLTNEYGNASSLYGFGQNSKQAIVAARESIANCLHCKPNEVYFTSGGSEADNWAIKMIAKEQAKKGKKHIISTAFEHHAVLHSLNALKEEGFEITLLPVYENGIIHVEDLENAIREDTALVTIMFANNEIGTIQPIKEVGAICKAHHVYFHTDAVQAVGHLPIDFVDMNIDLLSMSGHKFHGPKGIGALIIRNGIRFANLIDGGSQERNRRAGTENTAGIVGISEALKLALENLEQTNTSIIQKRNRIISELLKIEKSRLNGDANTRLPGNINISFEGIEGESLLLYLDMKGICASSGSACTSGSLDPSHVLLSIGLPHEIAHGSLRLTISESTTDEDVDYIIESVPQVVDRLRKMSPLWEKIKLEEGKE
ncbi:MAG: cysteine desulfurase NifS [Clostridia bacterium]|nr:cysteine desulfurase NifS [Clostridia bacterium]